jgi:hypothetical protein
MKTKAMLLPGLLLGLMSGGAFAANITGYCGSAGSFESTYTVAGVEVTDTISVNDVKFDSTIPADDCWGIKEGNPVENLGGLASVLWANATEGPWEFLLKDESAPIVSAVLPIDDQYGNPLDFTFTLDSTIGQTGGTWTLTVTPEDELPILLDFLVVLKGGEAWAAYLFDEQQIDFSVNNGTYQMVIQAGQGEGLAGLSNLSIYVRDYSRESENGGGGGGSVPEPGVLFLMGAGLLGLGMARRRKSA